MWQQVSQPNQFQDQQEAARANRRLIGSSNILSGLQAPRRLVSTLVSPQLKPPVNSLQMSQMNHLEDCICVPFFQCKNGHLSEWQLSKSQLQQIMAGQSLFGSGIQSSQHQVPRALPTDLPPTYTSQAPISSLMSQINPQSSQLNNDQRFVDDIYDQLRKNIENDKLEQQLLLQQQQQQQQPTYSWLDERSKGANQANQVNSTENEEVLERSLLKSPIRRSSQAKCGIMRTCCKIPANLLAAQQPPMQMFGPRGEQVNQFNPGQQYQLLRPTSHSQQQSLLGQVQTQPPFPVSIPIPMSSHNSDYQVSNSALSTLVEHPNQNIHSNQFATQLQANQQARPIGSFMAGRCGGRQTIGISGRVQNAQPAPGSESGAEFGEFPAHVAILKRISAGDSLFVCSASLISSQWLATAAHCVRKHRPEELKVRLGEWDVNRDDEFYPFVESNIRQIIIHPDFQASSLINDIALMRMETSIDWQQMPHIAPACLATPNEIFDGQRCWLAGWGKDAFGPHGAFQSALKKVDLPVVGRQDCETALRFQTKLGRYFRLHTSAICAGGERGKDACEGDGGAGLYCLEPQSGLSRLAGLVSWGVGCGQRGVPGVYTNTANFYHWIENVVGTSGEESLYQDRANENFKNVISERSNSGLALNTLNGTLVAPTQAPTSNSSSTQQSADGNGDSDQQVSTR